MIGGGNWRSQNKILNGTYINFVSKKSNTKKKYVVPDDPTPDTPDTPVIDLTSSVLGIATLGKMILGSEGL